MHRFSSALLGAAVSLALVASSAPTQAASPHPAPVVSQQTGIQMVGDRDRGRWRHRDRDRDSHFSFSFGVPFATYHQPYVYRAPVCPHGYWYDQYRHACFAYQPRYTHPYGYGGGVTFGFG